MKVGMKAAAVALISIPIFSLLRIPIDHLLEIALRIVGFPVLMKWDVWAFWSVDWAMVPGAVEVIFKLFLSLLVLVMLALIFVGVLIITVLFVLNHYYIFSWLIGPFFVFLLVLDYFDGRLEGRYGPIADRLIDKAARIVSWFVRIRWSSQRAKTEMIVPSGGEIMKSREQEKPLVPEVVFDEERIRRELRQVRADTSAVMDYITSLFKRFKAEVLIKNKEVLIRMLEQDTRLTRAEIERIRAGVEYQGLITELAREKESREKEHERNMTKLEYEIVDYKEKLRRLQEPRPSEEERYDLELERTRRELFKHLRFQVTTAVELYEEKKSLEKLIQERFEEPERTRLLRLLEGAYQEKLQELRGGGI